MAVKPGYKLTEVGVIPEDWEVKRLGEVTECLDNLRVPLNERQREKIQGDLPYCGANGILDYINSFSIDDDIILMAEDGGYFDEYDSRPIAYRMIGRCWVNNHAHILKALPSYNQDFLFWCLVHRNILSYLASGTRAKLNKSEMNKIEMSIPPLPEQHAIATALSDVDTLITKLDQLIAKKRDIKQATMQQLLTGQTRLPGFSGEWEVKRLGDVADTDPENLGSDTRPNFTFNYIALEDVDVGILRSYSEQVFRTAPSRARRKLRKADVLVSTVRPNLMSHLLFPFDGERWVCSTGFCVVRCKEGVSHPGYVYFHLFAGSVTRQIEALLTGSNYPAINSGDVRAFQILFPDYEEQTAIATILSDMDAEIAALEVKLAKARSLKQGMMQELLTGRIRLSFVPDKEEL